MVPFREKCLLVSNVVQHRIYNRIIMPEWRNGRRARLKIVYRMVWEFESLLRHMNLKTQVLPVFLNSMCWNWEQANYWLVNHVERRWLAETRIRELASLVLGTSRDTSNEVRVFVTRRPLGCYAHLPFKYSQICVRVKSSSSVAFSFIPLRLRFAGWFSSQGYS